MSKELIVSTGKHETRVAILEDDQLVEVFHEREKEYSLAGSIHKGRVTRVLPGMQSAFVDIGLERDAFLYVSDFFEDNEEYDAVVSTVEEKILKLDKRAEPEARQVSETARPAIVELTATPVAATPAASERGPERNGERSSNDRGQDRGQDRGRGRRGRRRRGGRDGGLPDSKFATPREADEATPELSAEVIMDEAVVAPAPPVHRYTPPPSRSSSPVSDDFMVLPGESLAKYSAPDDDAPQEDEDPHVPVQQSQHADLAEAAADIELPQTTAAHEPEPEPEAFIAAVEELVAADPVEPVFESAVPSEHPLAGLGDAQAWASEPVMEAEGVIIEEVISEPIDEIDSESAGQVESSADEDLSAEDDADQEDLAREDIAAETVGDVDQPVDSAEVDPEGPEPARIPTSLTATLREQGHRYPHRVSRRMRRKMRGGESGNREDRGPRPAAEAASDAHPVDGEPVEASAAPVEQQERRPEQREGSEQQRGDRGGRDRGGRDRGGRDRGNREAGSREAGNRDAGNRESGNRESVNRESGNREVSTRESGETERAERPERERPPLPSIADLLKEGQEIIVQIAKEPLGQKGARITSHIALPGRFVVYMPTVDHAGVSRKIPSDEERLRLKKIVQAHRQGIPGGFICRTAAEGKTEEELKSDMHFLYNLWLDMRTKAEKKPAPVLLHHDLDLVQRILRDQLTASFKNIWVDGEEFYESILRFAQRFQPALVGRVKLYTRPNPIFDEFGITQELEKALRPKVWLKSGGYIVINQTEALVAIDINTGKYVGKSNRLEDTIVKINTDAIKEIVRQIRLRDLGGIIVVDFIDMDERRNRQKVMQALEESMRSDRAPYKILQFNDFGLVAITRKRVKQSLERTLCSPCPYCEGAGYVKSVNTIVSEILQEAQRMHKALADPHNNVVLRVNPEVAKVLKSNQNQFLQEIEETIGKSVLVKGDPLLHQTKFDLA